MDEKFRVAALVNSYVKGYLRERGVKQGHLATELGYDAKKFSQLINGRVPMKIEDLSKICNYFKVPASEFIRVDIES